MIPSLCFIISRVITFIQKKHLQYFIKMLTRFLKKVNITIKPSKCIVCKKEVEYLGHIVGNDTKTYCRKS